MACLSFQQSGSQGKKVASSKTDLVSKEREREREEISETL
jgi:hypothetical protein